MFELSYTKEYRNLTQVKGVEPMCDLVKSATCDELKYRELFVTDRDNTVLSDNYVNLIPVHSNVDIFTVPELSQQERHQTVILTKAMDKLKVGTPVVVDKDEFKRNFDIFTEGVLDCINWNNVFVAGGSILAMLSPVPEEYRKDNKGRRKWFHDMRYKTSDIDMYIYGLDEDDATKKLYEIYESIKKVLLPKKCTCIRSARAITIVSQYPHRHVQLILRTFKSPAEVLMSFDVDCCAVGFDGKKVWCTPKAHYAMTHRVNTADVTRRSFAYEYRLKKYNDRGYGVVIPNYDASKINYKIFAKMPHQVTGLARLLVIENIDDNVKHKIYRDVLNVHQCTMFRNLSKKTSYEVSDYSLVFLPWGQEHTAETITELMRNKNKLINKETEKDTPQYLCFMGTMYEVVRDNNVSKPAFKTPQEESTYMSKYVCDTLKWYSGAKSISGSKLLTGFNHIETTWDEWYKDAVDRTYTDELCDLISQNNVDKVRDLLEVIKSKNPEKSAKEYVNDRDIACRNSLHLAIQMKNYDMVRLLLDNGADPMVVSKLYKTAVHTACEVGDVHILRCIVESGSKMEAFNAHKRDSYKLSPILYTIMYGNFDAFVYMYKNVMKKHTDLVWIFKYDKIKSYRALEMCLMFKRYDIAEYLLKNGYDCHDYYVQDSKVTSRYKVHILSRAVELCDMEFINLLIDNTEKGTYAKYVPECGAVLAHIKKNTKNASRVLYAANIVHYMYKLNPKINTHHMGDLMNHLVVTRQFDVFKELMVKWDYEPLNLCYGNVTILDQVNTLINNNMNELQVVAINNCAKMVENPLIDLGLVTTTDPDASELLKNEKYRWIIKLLTTSKNVTHTEMEDTIKLTKYNEYLQSVKEFILAHKGDSYYNLTGERELREAPTVGKCNATVKYPYTSVCIKFSSDLKGTRMLSQTANYIRLFTAVKEGDAATVRKLTVEADKKVALQMYAYLDNFKPLDIAIHYGQGKMIPVIMEIIQSQTKTKKKSKDCKTARRSKKFVNNKKLLKKVSDDRDESDGEDDVELYEEYSIDELNPLAICDFSVSDLLNSAEYVKYAITENQPRSLDVLLGMGTELIEKDFMKNINSLLVTACKSENYSALLDVIFKYYAQYVKKYDEEKIKYEGLKGHVFVNMLMATYSKDILGYLLEHCGMYWTLRDKLDGRNVLHCLVQQDTKLTSYKEEYIELVNEIVKMCPELLSELDSQGMTPLMKSVAEPECDLFFEIVVDKSDLKVRYGGDMTVFHKAIALNRTKMFKLLLANCNVDERTGLKGQTPLMLAIKHGRLHMGKELLKMQPDESIRDIFGNTALHYAMFYHSYPMVKGLVYHTRENYFRMTPYDYVVNCMKSFFHHSRNKKLVKSFNPVELRFIVAIYNKFVSSNARTRHFAGDEGIKEVNRYVFDQLRNIKGDQANIPEELVL
jgi:ankyrin repeat protein